MPVKAKLDIYSALRQPSAWLLILSNMIPLGGVLFFGWNIGLILLIYWIETVLIGVFNVPKLLTAQGTDGAPQGQVPGLFGRFFLAAFFTVHYGGFNAGHFFFLKDMFDLPPIGMVPWIAVLGLALSHGGSLMINWFGRGEFRDSSANMQMFKPYGRIVIMHVVILIGGAMVQAFGAPIIALILLIVLKIIVDLTTHMVSHTDAAKKVIVPV